MDAVSTEENLPFETSCSQSKHTSVENSVDLNYKADVYEDLNSNNEENDDATNGETENVLAPSIDDNKSRCDSNDAEDYEITVKPYRSDDKTPYNLYNAITRPAGLSSDRCVRDFMSAKYKKYHWNLSKMNNYTETNLNTDSNNTTKTNNTLDTDTEAVKDIAKSNYLMRRENRLRNMGHSDIFGASNVDNKRILSLNSDNDYDAKLVNRTTKNAEYDDYYVAKRLRSTDSYSSNSESCSEISNYTSSTTDAVTKTAGKNTDINNNTLYLIHVSGLKSNSSEQQLINFCDSCKLKLLSVHLDRNIITHTCTGTGTIKVWSSKVDLEDLLDLLRQNSFKCRVK